MLSDNVDNPVRKISVISLGDVVAAENIIVVQLVLGIKKAPEKFEGAIILKMESFVSQRLIH